MSWFWLFSGEQKLQNASFLDNLSVGKHPEIDMQNMIYYEYVSKGQWNNMCLQNNSKTIDSVANFWSKKNCKQVNQITCE